MHLYAAAASPAGQRALELASEGPRTKGFMGYFAVTLMFLMLAGGVYLLLQSSFGPKVGYLMTGTAFFGCWLILSLLWLSGVPAVNLPFLPRWGIPDVARSTPQYTGPQGDESSWQLALPGGKHGSPEGATFSEVDPKNLTDQNLTEEVTAATTAAGQFITSYYASTTGADPALIAPNSVYVVTNTEVLRQDRRAQWVRLTTGPATPNAAASEETKALISKIQPVTMEMYFVEGDLANKTYYAVGIFTLLFVAHAVGLAMTEKRPATQPQGAPERLVTV